MPKIVCQVLSIALPLISVIGSLILHPPRQPDYSHLFDDLTLPYCPHCGLELRPRSVPDRGDRVIRLWCDCCRQFPRQPVKPEERR